MIVIGDISELLNGLSAAAYLFYILSFSSLLIMRVTRRREPRPFKVPYSRKYWRSLYLAEEP